MDPPPPTYTTIMEPGGPNTKYFLGEIIHIILLDIPVRRVQCNSMFSVLSYMKLNKAMTNFHSLTIRNAGWKANQT